MLTHVVFLQVEKQKIMKDSAGKLLNRTSEGVSCEVSTVTCQEAAAVTALDSSKGSSKLKLATLPMQLNSASTLRGKDMTPAKKPSSRPLDFFQR
jgi:chromosome transmission fidelity protein 18